MPRNRRPRNSKPAKNPRPQAHGMRAEDGADGSNGARQRLWGIVRQKVGSDGKPFIAGNETLGHVEQLLFLDQAFGQALAVMFHRVAQLFRMAGSLPQRSIQASRSSCVSSSLSRQPAAADFLSAGIRQVSTLR